MQATRSHRGLSTARAALSVTWLLARAPEGVRADEVAESLGKSVSTAYNVLASLCDERVAERLPGGLYHLAPGFRECVAEESDRHDLSGVVDDLLARTHKRAYLSAGLKRFAPDAITDPNALRTDLRRARRTGIATDREEIASDFCCIAAPLLDEHGHFLGAAGISMSVRAFDAEREHLTEVVRDVVGFEAYADRRDVLDRGRTPVLASGEPRRLRQRRLHS